VRTLSKKTSKKNAIEEAKKIIKVAEDKKVTLRVIGGLAVRYHCHGPHSVHLRAYHDIDLFGLEKESKKIFSVFQELGYIPNKRFNVLNGAHHLQFIEQESGKNVNIFLDKFKMDHTLNFRDRLHLDRLIIPITVLLLTKFQIEKFTRKDGTDIIAILEDHKLGDTDEQETLNINYIAELCSRNWGLYKTITNNLTNLINLIKKGTFSTREEDGLVSKLETIQNVIKTKKKTLRWKLRSLLGEKVNWYEEVGIGEGEVY